MDNEVFLEDFVVEKLAMADGERSVPLIILVDEKTKITKVVKSKEALTSRRETQPIKGTTKGYSRRRTFSRNGTLPSIHVEDIADRELHYNVKLDSILLQMNSSNMLRDGHIFK